MKRAAIIVALIAPVVLAGCFREAVPARATGADVRRVYLQNCGLEHFRSADVAAKGRVFVEDPTLPPRPQQGAQSHGAWKAFSALESAPALQVIDYLNLDGNRLTNTAEIAGFTGLKWLRLNGNKLKQVEGLSTLKQLRRLYLRDNLLAAVPPEIEQLEQLTDLDLSGNPLTSVPEWLARKPGLKCLSLNRTRIESLPEDLSAWRSLQMLQLGGIDGMSLAEMQRIRAALPQTVVVF